jgi:dGTPase
LFQSSSDPPHREDRLTAENKPNGYREPAQRDYDRILYSSALRRLGGVTQVVASHEGHVFHNRLTHSMRVAQIGRRLAQRLLKKAPEEAREVGGIDPDVVEAAALAHDLGHPPFGHIAEEELRDCAVKRDVLDGFEGNAQSFRIVTKLALRSNEPGLNLTRATLNALLKYPWTRQAEGYEKEKYGLYNSETEHFNFARKLQPPGDKRKSAEAEIMDWADDVTYAVHDAEDFYRAGLVPLDRLASLDDESERQRSFDGMYKRSQLGKQLGKSSRAQLEEAFRQVVTAFPISEPYTGSREHRSRLRDFSSNLIGLFVNAIDLRVPANQDERFVEITPLQSMQVRILKALTWFYVIYNPALATQQFGQRKIIRELFEIFVNSASASDEQERNIIPFAFRDEIYENKGDSAAITRIVTDMISGMTEQGLTKLYRRLTGIDMGSILDYKHGS